MAGTVKGRVQIYCTNGDIDTNSQEVFVSLYKALKLLEIAGYVTEVANNYGSSGSSLDYGGPGQNAFYVFKFPPYGTRTVSWYFLIQWTDTGNFGTAPGNPGKVKAGTGDSGSNIGIQMAAATDSGSADDDPWANAGGGTGKAGADAKGDPVWDDDGAGGTLYVFPRSNNAGGSHNTSKENCVALLKEYATTRSMRVNLIVDRDNLAITLDQEDADLPYVVCCGLYDPIDGLSPEIPLFMYGAELYASTSGPVWDLAIGGTAGSATNEGGAVATKDDTVRAYKCFYRNDADGVEHYQPDRQFLAENRYIQLRIPIYVDEGSPNVGIVGFMDAFFRAVSGRCLPGITFAAKTRCTVGVLAQVGTNWTFPWDGVSSTRDMTSDRDGTDF